MKKANVEDVRIDVKEILLKKEIRAIARVRGR